MKCIILIVLMVTHVSYSVIYRLNDTDYFRMPPVYHLDDYDSCVYETNGTYCYVEMDLVSDKPSELLQMIHEYSEHTTKHFNHTKLHHGICLTKTCKDFLQHNNVLDTRWVLETCLNESLWRNYKLKTRISDTIFCKKLDNAWAVNIGDICAAAFFVSIGLLNIIGSLYDFIFIKEGKGNRFLLSFSFKRNLEKLFLYDDTDVHRGRLKGIHGLRTLSIILVILAHAPLPLVISTENTHGLEKQFDNIVFQLFYNGTLIVQTFFIITGCLMGYNTQMYFEKNKRTWILIPKGILMRWLRLTPANAVVLIFTLTWMRFIASGPLWEVAVGREIADCRRDGWLNMIYVNNYIDNSQCMAQTWYLAADMQLYILGLLICVLAKTSKVRNLVLSALFLIGAVIPAIPTYIQDLDAIVLMAPEMARNLFVTYPTFNYSYKRGHTNIPGLVLGLALGNFIYKGLRDEGKLKIYKKLGFLYYLIVPMAVALVMSGMVFYKDEPRPSVYLRAALAVLFRPLFALLVTIFIIGMVFKFENVYRRILEWSGWRIPARVSYSAYLIHVTIVRIFSGMNTTLSRTGLAQCFKEGFAIIFMTFLIAYPFWLLVEAPLNQAVLIILGLSKNIDKEHDLKNTEIPIREGKPLEKEDKSNVQINIRL